MISFLFCGEDSLRCIVLVFQVKHTDTFSADGCSGINTSQELSLTFVCAKIGLRSASDFWLSASSHELITGSAKWGISLQHGLYPNYLVQQETRYLCKKASLCILSLANKEYLIEFAFCLPRPFTFDLKN